MILETERLILRSIERADKIKVFDYRSDSETNKYQGWIPETVEDVENFIGKIAEHVNKPDSWYQYVIIEKESEKLIGDLGIHFLEEGNEQAEIGCTLNKTYQNNGYATEAVKKVVDYLFRELKKHRVFTSIDPENQSSIRLVERLGFRKEAHFVESLFLDGKWVDDLVFALKAKEWTTSQEQKDSFNFPTLATDRFVLRQFTKEDLKNVYLGLSDPEVIKYYGIRFDSLEATKEQMIWFADLEKNGKGIWWAICSKEDSMFLGAGGLNDLDKENRKAEIGFWLLPENWGKEIMKEVMPIICDYGFNNFGLHRIEGFVDSNNVKCKKALHKLDFNYEGTMVDCEIKNGEYVSIDLYSMINDRE